MRALSAWLDANLFRQGPSPPPLTVRRLLAGFAVALAGVAVVLARLGWSPPLDSLYAEDGTVFYSGALHVGLLEAVRTTYAGYLLVIPRLLAEPATWFSIDDAPKVIAVEAASVTVLCAFVVWWASSAHLRDPMLRGLLAALVVLLPVVGYETLASLAYLQWFLLFPVFWLLLWRPPGSKQAIATAGFLFLAVASSPLTLLFTPLAAARGLVVRSRRDVVLLGGFALGAAAQVIGIAFDQSAPQPGPGFGPELFALYPLRIVAGAFTGEHGVIALWHAQALGASLFGLVFAGLLVLAIRRPGPERALSLLMIGLSAAIFLIEGYQRDLSALLDLPASLSVDIGARYAVLPTLLLIAGVLLVLGDRPAGGSGPSLGWPRLAVCGVIAVAALSSFYVGDPARDNHPWSTGLAGARAACATGRVQQARVPVSAAAPTGWNVNVPCDEL